MSGRRQHCTSRVRSRQDPVDCCIDKLQDELLVAILSYLSVKEAATTSLVSHRWRYLWQYTTGCLEIYDRDGRTAVPEVAREFIKLNVHPQLSELTTGDEYCYYFIFYADEHTSYACGLRKLKLKVPPLVLRRSWNSSVYPSYNIPRLDNLRELELELDLELQAGASLLFFTIFCKASPLLARFTARIRYIQVFDEERIREMADVEHTHCVHNNLKVVKLIGFTGCTSDFELALHLLEIGGSLEEMILQPTNDLHHPKVMKLASIQDWSKQLEAKLPPGAKLVML